MLSLLLSLWKNIDILRIGFNVCRSEKNVKIVALVKDFSQICKLIFGDGIIGQNEQ